MLSVLNRIGVSDSEQITSAPLPFDTLLCRSHGAIFASFAIFTVNWALLPKPHSGLASKTVVIEYPIPVKKVGLRVRAAVSNFIMKSSRGLGKRLIEERSDTFRVV